MSGTITHKWNGTVLTVTSDSGTSSADLKGAQGEMGIRGPQGATGDTKSFEEELSVERARIDDIYSSKRPVVLQDRSNSQKYMLYAYDSEAMLCAIKGGTGANYTLQDIETNNLYNLYIDNANLYYELANSGDMADKQIKVIDRLTYLSYCFFIENGEIKISEV